MRVPLHNGPWHNRSVELDEPLPPRIRMVQSALPWEPNTHELQVILHEYGLQQFRGAGRVNYGYTHLGPGETITVCTPLAAEPAPLPLFQQAEAPRRRGRPPKPQQTHLASVTVSASAGEQVLPEDEQDVPEGRPFGGTPHV